MANFRFDQASEDFLRGLIKWDPVGGDTFKVVLVDTAVWVPSKANSHYLSEAAGATVGTAVALTDITYTDGVADAADATLTSVTGNECEGVLLYQDTGDAATSILIYYWDTPATAGQLPTTPSGGNYTIKFASAGIFSLKGA
jgi:hypothetical protein